MLTTFSPSRFNVNFHVAFHHAVLIRLQQAGAENLGILQQELDAYESAIEAEQDCVRKTYGSAITVEIQTLDQERDNLFRHIRNRLINLANSSNAELSALAPLAEEKLIALFGADIPNMGMQEESALIRGFVGDAQQFFTTDQLTKMGIKEDLIQLASLNDQFEEKYLERIDEYATQEKGLAERLRQDTDACYARLCPVLNYMSSIGRYGTDYDKTCAPEATSVVRALNVLIDKYLTLQEISSRTNKRKKY